MENVRPFISRLHFFVCFEVEISLRTLVPFFIVYARISPQGLGELRGLWLTVP